ARTRFIGEVSDCACHFEVAQVWISAARRHGVNAVDGVGEQSIKAFGDQWAPSGSVTQLMSASDTRRVTGGTGGSVDLLTGTLFRGSLCAYQGEARDRLDALRHSLLRLSVGTDTERRAIDHQANEQGDHHNWHNKGQQDDGNELLGSLDEAFVLSRLFDVLFRSVH